MPRYPSNRVFRAEGACYGIDGNVDFSWNESGKNWHEAAAYVRHAGLIIEYLGTNVSILKCMNLRDYLQLKVEIEGTSGEGNNSSSD